MVKKRNGCKTLEIPWWLQLSKRQILTFLPRLSFGTVRSEVRILSPRPINFKHLRLPAKVAVLVCGRMVANPLTCWSYRFHRSSFRSVRRVRIASRSLRIRVSHQIGNRRLTATRLREPGPERELTPE